MRAKDGTVTGYYSYAGGDGRAVYVSYVADKNGYRVLQSGAGVPPSSSASASTTGEGEKTAEDDFRKVFSDFTERIKVTTIRIQNRALLKLTKRNRSRIAGDSFRVRSLE